MDAFEHVENGRDGGDIEGESEDDSYDDSTATFASDAELDAKFARGAPICSEQAYINC